MPEFTVEFEAYCDCGFCICDHVTTRRSRTWDELQIVVKPCENCMKEKRSEIDDLKDQIGDLEKQIESLKSDIHELEKEIDGLKNELNEEG